MKISERDRLFLGELPHNSVDEVNISVDQKLSELFEFFQILGTPMSPVIPEKYLKMMRILSSSGKESLMMMPAPYLKDRLQKALREIQNTLCDHENADYLVTYMTVKRFLQGLSRALVDSDRLRQKIDDTPHETTKSALRSFLPKNDGMTAPVVYSMSATATGRLTVVDGPKILTIPASARSCLKSRYQHGKILQIDLISAEPKFALQLKGTPPPKDVYAYVSREILGNQVTREQAKLITLCALYGQSMKKLDAQLPDQIGARGVVHKTKKYFDREYLLDRLRYENKSGNFRNAIGRPIQIPKDNTHLMVSYYLQSSVAEASILMFSRFIQETKMKCVPLYVIHDALILDCDEVTAKSLLSKKDLQLSLGDWKFDAEVKHVGE